MRLQGLFIAAMAGGIAFASLGMTANESQAQCTNCGSNATPYNPGVSYVSGGVAGSGNCYGGGCASDLGPEAYSQYIGKGVQPLFDNYFTQGNANQATAAMYMSPIGVPGWVGHTYYTYQPFYPHQYLYHHHDRYHSYYDNGRGLNRTKASYSSPPVRTTLHWAHKTIRLPHQ
jgi:hypothetical protein